MNTSGDQVLQNAGNVILGTLGSQDFPEEHAPLSSILLHCMLRVYISHISYVLPHIKSPTSSPYTDTHTSIYYN